MSKPIQIAWECFSVLTIPPDAPDDLRRVSKAAFYAGAVAFLDVLLEQADDYSQTSADQIVQDLIDELDAFFPDRPRHTT